MSSRQPIEVLTLADAAYAMPLAVMGLSLLEQHSSGRPLRLTVVDGGILPEDRERLEATWRGAAGGPASWRFVPPDYGGAQRLPVWGRVTRVTYARLAMANYMEPGATRVVLLDPDTLVLGSIAEFHDAPLGEGVIGACIDPFIPTFAATDGIAAWERLGFAAETPYFNAGVMTVDLERWRREQILEEALAFLAAEHGELRQYDQDALNVALAGRWTRLHDGWNTHPRAANALGGAHPERPHIIHFSGRLKPWVYAPNGPFDRLWRECLERTAWRGTVPPRGLAALALRAYDTPLRRFLLPVERRVTAWKRRIDQRTSARVRGDRPA
jgi:lipopolysaccharide biosynthesis glycosyltransferase